MELIRHLEDTYQDDIASAGGKGVNLGELVRAGLPVPAGFVVLTSAYQFFVELNGIQEGIEQLANNVSVDELSSAEHISSAIRALFDGGQMPDEVSEAVLAAYIHFGEPTVAVRSSATAEDLAGASFAGQQESYLNIHKGELLTAVKRCWSSLWTARAIDYRARKGIKPGVVSMAVVVQEMVQASVSGVLFTCNPVTGAQNEIVIDASWGLGEAIVSGHVSPDVITIDKESGQVKRKVAEKLLMSVPAGSGIAEQVAPSGLRQQAVLSEEQIAQLFQLGRTIEQRFQAAQDIEWAIADSQVFVLQARPVTTRPRLQTVTVHQTDLPVPGDDDWDRQTEPPVQAYDLWTRTNLGENFPDPVTPLSATLWPTFFMLGRMPTKAERAPDAAPLPTFGPRFYGRIYVNEGAVIHIASEAGIPTSFLDTTWGSSERGLRSSDDTFHLFRLLRRLPSMAKMGMQQARQQPKTAKQKSQKTPNLRGRQLFMQVDQWVDDFQQQDMQQLNDSALWNRWLPLWIERAKALRSILVTAQLAGLTYYLLERRVSKWTGKKGQAMLLVQALAGVYTAEVGQVLWSMAHTLRGTHLDEIVRDHSAAEALALLQEQPEAQPFIAELQAFLQRHGYRCPNDAELHNPRWAEALEQVIELIKSYLHMDDTANPVKTEQRRQQEREVVAAQIVGQLNPVRRWIFRWLLRQAQDKIRFRDNNRSYVAKFLYPMRLLIVEIGRRWKDRGWLASPDDIFFLTLYEIDDIVSSNGSLTPGKDLVALVNARRAAFDYWCTIEAPSALGPGGVPLPDPELAGTFLQGLPASAGRVHGTARLVRSLDEASRLSAGDILVTQATDPGWTPLFPLVGGLVLEVGGQLSHGAIIAREYGVPAVINVPGAMRNIKDGQMIVVDGTNGRVYLEDIVHFPIDTL